jgi:hypothetical protein
MWQPLRNTWSAVLSMSSTVSRPAASPPFVRRPRPLRPRPSPRPCADLRSSWSSMPTYSMQPVNSSGDAALRGWPMKSCISHLQRPASVFPGSLIGPRCSWPSRQITSLPSGAAQPSIWPSGLAYASITFFHTWFRAPSRRQSSVLQAL